MEQGISELAGNLKAELLVIKDDWKTGRIPPAVALKRIDAIKRYRELVQKRYQAQREGQAVTGRLFA